MDICCFLLNLGTFSIELDVEYNSMCLIFYDINSLENIYKRYPHCLAYFVGLIRECNKFTPIDIDNFGISEMRVVGERFCEFADMCV
jgi:hypothetical protein